MAAAAAVVTLLTVVLPAEYGIDPTGIGRALQLTQTGENEKQLATEAEQNRLRDLPETPAPVPALAPERKSTLVTLMAGPVVSPAYEVTTTMATTGCQRLHRRLSRLFHRSHSQPRQARSLITSSSPKTR